MINRSARAPAPPRVRHWLHAGGRAVVLAAALLATPAHGNSLSRDAIIRPIQQRMPRIRHCYRAALARHKTLPDGRMTVRFTIARGGLVTIVRTTRDDLGDATLARCVRRVLLGMRYYPAPPGRNTIYFPFVFRKR